jgi:glycosidase
VAAEDRDPASLLNHYRTLIALRKTYPALQTGTLALLDTGSTAIFASLRQEGSQLLLVLINLSAKPVSDYKLGSSTGELPDGAYHPKTIFGSGSASQLTISAGKFADYHPLAELAPQSTTIFSLK